MGAPPEALASPGDLVAYSRELIDASSAALLLDLASDIVRGEVGWTITSSEQTWRGTGRSGPSLLLPTLSLLSVSAASVNGVPLDVTRLRALPDGRLWGPVGWSGGPDSVVEVTFTHGYEEVPLAVVAVVLGLASRLYTNPMSESQENIDGISQSHVAGATGLLATERWILSRYTLPPVGA